MTNRTTHPAVPGYLICGKRLGVFRPFLSKVVSHTSNAKVRNFVYGRIRNLTTQKCRFLYLRYLFDGFEFLPEEVFEKTEER